MKQANFIFQARSNQNFQKCTAHIPQRDRNIRVHIHLCTRIK